MFVPSGRTNTSKQHATKPQQVGITDLALFALSGTTVPADGKEKSPDAVSPQLQARSSQPHLLFAVVASASLDVVLFLLGNPSCLDVILVVKDSENSR